MAGTGHQHGVMGVRATAVVPRKKQVIPSFVVVHPGGLNKMLVVGQGGGRAGVQNGPGHAAGPETEPVGAQLTQPNGAKPGAPIQPAPPGGGVVEGHGVDAGEAGTRKQRLAAVDEGAGGGFGHRHGQAEMVGTVGPGGIVKEVAPGVLAHVRGPNFLADGGPVRLLGQGFAEIVPMNQVRRARHLQVDDGAGALGLGAVGVVPPIGGTDDGGVREIIVDDGIGVHGRRAMNRWR